MALARLCLFTHTTVSVVVHSLCAGKLVHYTRTKKAGVGKEEDANELISSAKMWYNKALVAASGKLSTSSVGLQSSELLWQVKWRMGQLLCNFGTAGEQQQAKDDLNSAISLNARLAVHNEVSPQSQCSYILARILCLTAFTLLLKGETLG